MRRFVIVGQRAKASPDFLLVDIPGTSGRLDVLIRCLRAALLISHGLRRDTIVYLVLLGAHERGPAVRTIKIDGTAARYMRPDERSLATTLKKALAVSSADTTPASDTVQASEAFVVARPGIAIANAGLAAVIADVAALEHARWYVLEEAAPDLRTAPLELREPVFVIGDHLGFDPETRQALVTLGAEPLSVGPISLHAEDVVSLVCNELDRRAPPVLA